MSDLVVRTAMALLLPTAIVVARHSALVALGVALPFFANLYEMQSAAALPVEHPARVLVSAASMAFGFAEFYADVRNKQATSRGAVCGVLVMWSGGIDIAALPAFRALGDWAVPPLSILVCLALIVVSTWPKKWRIPWVSSSRA